MLRPKHAKHTLYRRAANDQRASTQAWGTILKNRDAHVAYTGVPKNVRQTCSNGIQRACNACGTYSKRIKHTHGTRRASRKFLSMFKSFLSRNALRLVATYSDAHRTDTKRTLRTRNVFSSCPLTCS